MKRYADDELLLALCKPAPRPEAAVLSALAAAIEDNLATYLEPRRLALARWLFETATQESIPLPDAWPAWPAPGQRPEESDLLELVVDLALEASDWWDAVAWLVQTAAPEVCDTFAHLALIADTDHLLTAWVTKAHADAIVERRGHAGDPFQLTEDECVLVHLANVLRFRLAQGDGDATTLRAVLGKIDRILSFAQRYVEVVALSLAPVDLDARLRASPELLAAAQDCLAAGVDLRRLLESVEDHYAAHRSGELGFDYLEHLARDSWNVSGRPTERLLDAAFSETLGAECASSRHVKQAAGLASDNGTTTDGEAEKLANPADDSLASEGS